MSSKVIVNKEGKLEKINDNNANKLFILKQRKKEVLNMIHREGNNITRGIYKTQLLHIDIEIQKLEKAQ